MSLMEKINNLFCRKKKIEAISFNQGDVIEYTDPAFKKEKLSGLILDKDEKTYKVKWFGYYSEVSLQTKEFIESRSKILVTTLS